MNDDTTMLLIAAAVVAYLAFTGKLGGIFGRADEVPASGVPPRPPSRNTAGAVGAGVCVAVGVATQNPALGAAAAPLCALAAPYVVKGLVWGAEKVADGAVWGAEKVADAGVFIGKNAYSGLKATGNELKDLGNNPVTYALSRTEKAVGLVGDGVHLVDRGLDAGYNALPTFWKVPAAPIYAASQIGVKAGEVAVDVTKGVVNAVTTVFTDPGSLFTGPSVQDQVKAKFNAAMLAKCAAEGKIAIDGGGGYLKCSDSQGAKTGFALGSSIKPRF